MNENARMLIFLAAYTVGIVSTVLLFLRVKRSLERAHRDLSERGVYDAIASDAAVKTVRKELEDRIRAVFAERDEARSAVGIVTKERDIALDERDQMKRARDEALARSDRDRGDASKLRDRVRELEGERHAIAGKFFCSRCGRLERRG